MSDTLNNANPDSIAASGAPKANDEPTTTSGFDRRDFLRVASLGTSAILTASCASTQTFTPVAGMTNRSKPSGGDVGHVVVVGAGAWGSWTAFHLRQRGVRVTHIDQYGAGNSRQTSGDESRGIRSSYGDRATVALWTKWARAAIKRWEEFDLQYGAEFGTKFYYTTGDVIMRAADEPFLKNTREQWVKEGVKHEVITGEEVRKRWPVINADDTTIALVEPDAGVARARASTQAIAKIGQRNGVDFRVSRVKPGPIVGGKMDGVILEDGTVIKADQYVFCVGAWARKMFPQTFETRASVPMGTVMYYGTPPGDYRFQYPNLPSFNFPGVTGWAVLPHDSRGFRVRGGINAAPAAGAAPAPAPAANTPRPPATPADPNQNDPDLSTRWAPAERLEGTRRFVARRFPLLADAPLLETRACHYDSSINRDFIVDHLPGLSNAWFAGMGQSEGFKFAPIVGEYVAQRVMGIDGDPALIKAFAMPTQEYEQNRNREEEEF